MGRFRPRDPGTLVGRINGMPDREQSAPDPAGAEPEQEPWAAEPLPGVLADSAPTAVGRNRLLQAASSWSLRYAPFYDRLGALWDLGDPELRAVFESAADSRHWQRPWPGFGFLTVDGGPGLAGARARLLHLAPAFHFPRHRHQGPERILVLAGSYTDSATIRVGPGELQEMAAGSEHELLIGHEGPCVAAVVEQGLTFTGPLLKLLTRWFSL